jgi:soluble lytic murein transglycosylase-like protein
MPNLKILHTLVLLLILVFPSFSEIIVRQDKDGKITVANKASYSDKGVKFRTSSYSAEIPYGTMLKIKKLAAKHRLREDLIIAVARTESGFNPYAVSKKGAAGIMQLMPKTASIYGVTNRFDVDQNLEGGIKHLKYLYEKYNNNLPLTLACYNAGEEAVKNFNGIPPFRETINFITRSMKHMGLKYSSYFNLKPRKKLYKYTNNQGRIVISDSLPAHINGSVEILD